MLQIESDFRQYLDDAERCVTGVMTLGGTTLFTSYVLPPLLSAFSERCPGVELRLNEAHTARLKGELQEGTLDFVIDNCAFDPTVYESQLLKREQVILAVPRSLPLSPQAAPFRLSAAQLTIKDAPRVPLPLFADVPFHALKEGNDTRARAERSCAQAGFTPHIRLQLDQQLAGLQSRQLRTGRGVHQRTRCAERAPDERLVYYRIDSPDVERSIRLFYKRTRVLTAPMRALLDMLDRSKGRPKDD